MRQFTRAGIYAVPHTVPVSKSGTAKLSATGALVPIVANQYRDTATFSSTGGLAVTGQVATTVTLTGSGKLTTAGSSITAQNPAAVKLTGSGLLAHGTVTVTGGGGGGTGNIVVKINAKQLQDSIGVVIHTTYTGGLYSNLNLVISSMVDMGITHFRTGIFPTAYSSAELAFNANAAAAGLKANVLIDKAWGTSPNPATIYNRIVSDYGLAMVASAEGNNESDNFWTTSQGKAQQAVVYPYFKKQSTWGSRPFIGCSMAQTTGYSSYGFDTNLDAIVLHGYEHHFNQMPEDGRLLDWINAGQAVFGKTLPLWNTEHGYNYLVGNQSGGTNAWVPADVAGDYLVRAFLYETVTKGITRHFIYELFDDVSASAGREQNFGLVDKNGTPKESYNRIKRFLGRLSDTGSGTAPTSVSYTLGSTGSDVTVIPISRTDGTFDLMIYRAASIWDSTNMVRLTPSDVAVPITLPSAKQIVQYTPDNGTTTTISSSASSFTIQANGRVKMVRIG